MFATVLDFLQPSPHLFWHLLTLEILIHLVRPVSVIFSSRVRTVECMCWHVSLGRGQGMEGVMFTYIGDIANVSQRQTNLRSTMPSHETYSLLCNPRSISPTEYRLEAPPTTPS